MAYNISSENLDEKNRKVLESGKLNEKIIKHCIPRYIFGIEEILRVLKTDEQKIKLLEYFDYLIDNKLEITRDIIYAEAVRISKEF